MINLLKDMAAQLEKEGEEDQEVFEKVTSQPSYIHLTLTSTFSNMIDVVLKLR